MPVVVTDTVRHRHGHAVLASGMTFMRRQKLMSCGSDNDEEGESDLFTVSAKLISVSFKGNSCRARYFGSL